MDREMININANLVKEVELSEFERDGEKQMQQILLSLKNMVKEKNI